MNESMHILPEGRQWWIQSFCESKPTTHMIYDIHTYLHPASVTNCILRTKVVGFVNVKVTGYYQCLLIEVMQANSLVTL